MCQDCTNSKLTSKHPCLRHARCLQNSLRLWNPSLCPFCPPLFAEADADPNSQAVITLKRIATFSRQWLGVNATIKLSLRPNSAPYGNSCQNSETVDNFSNVALNPEESRSPWSNNLDRVHELESLLGPSNSNNPPTLSGLTSEAPAMNSSHPQPDPPSS